MALTTGMQVGRELAAALGLDPDKDRITAITVRAAVRDMATVTVEMFVTGEQVGALAAVVRKYRLVPIPDPDPPQ